MRATAWRSPSWRRRSRSTAPHSAPPSASPSSSPTTAASDGSRSSPSRGRRSEPRPRGHRRLRKFVVTAPTKSSLAREIGVFVAPEYDGLEPFFAEHGFAIMRGIYTDEDLRNLEVELEHQQQRLLAGELPKVCGTMILDDPDAVIDGEA